MDLLVKLLNKDTEIKDAENATELNIEAANIEFDRVYSLQQRPWDFA